MARPGPLALLVLAAAVAAGCKNSNTVAGPGPTATPAPSALPTAVSGPPTAAPSPTATPAPVQTIVVNVRAWDFSPGGPISPPLVVRVGTTYTLVFHDVDPPGTTNPRHGFTGISELGLPPTDNISPGSDFVIPGFTPQAYQRGTYPFACTQSDCGGDPEQHAGMIGSLLVQ
jgi:hypothetical protein